jgi:hypothetical protein
LNALNKAFQNFVAVERRTAENIIKAETRLLLRDLVKLTPPTVEGENPIRAKLGKQRRAGLNAVANDIKRLYTPIKKFDLLRRKVRGKEGKLGRTLRKYVDRGEFAKITDIIHAIPTLNAVYAGALKEATKKHHLSWRNRRGRVYDRKPNTFLVGSEGSIAEVLRSAQAKVGQAKAGWATACEVFKVKIPLWVQNQVHMGGGRFTPGDSPTSESWNSVNYLQKHGQGIFYRAVAYRIKSLQIRTEKTIEWLVKHPRTTNRKLGLEGAEFVIVD